MSPPSPIQVRPLGPVAGAAVAWRQGPATGVTVVVKASFGLVPEGVARLVGPANVVREDRFGTSGTSLETAGELAPYLPSCGVILHGTAHAPGGQPTRAMSLRLGVFRDRPLLNKVLHVVGDRPRHAPGSPQPFLSMPIVYERAFGGPTIADNPAGTGAAQGSPLPNVIDPRRPDQPAGFGPIAPMWGPRRRLLGAHGAPPLTALPEHVDWRWFQAAPVDQQIPGLQGDEWVVLDGLHPSVPQLRTRLPGAHAHARWQLMGAGGAGPQHVIELVPDMLILRPDAQLCFIVWRGRVMIDPADVARMQVLAGIDTPGHPLATELVRPPAQDAEPAALPSLLEPEDTNNQTYVATEKIRVGDLHATLPFKAPRRPAPPASEPKDALLSTATSYDVPAQLRPAPLPFRGAAGPLPELRGDAPRGGSKPILDALPFMSRERDDEEGSTRVVDLRQLKLALPFDGAGGGPGAPEWIEAVELSSTELVSDSEPPPPLRPPSVSAGEPGAAVVADDDDADRSTVMPPPPIAPPLGAPTMTESASNSRKSVPPPVVQPAIPAPPPMGALASVVSFGEPPKPPPQAVSFGEPPKPPPQAPSTGVRADVVARVLARQPLVDMPLAGADLCDLDLTGALLAGANLLKTKLSRCKLVNARLGGAQLADADLSGADLSGADLTSADLARARLEGARLSGAKLVGASLAGAQGRGATFEDAVATNAVFTSGVWDEASFARADATRADFTGASLAGAHLEGATLAEARLDEVRGRGAVFDDGRLAQVRVTGASLAGARFERVDAPRSVWDRSTLDGALFTDACLKEADFSRASCARASFAGADLASANFQRVSGDGADLTGARLGAADLRQARLQDACFDRAVLRDVTAGKADLTRCRFVRAELQGATLRGARLSGASFVRADLEGTDLRDADLEGANVFGASRRSAKFGTGAKGLVEVDVKDAGDARR